ncbi:MAG TPA: protein translocase subunit SecF [Burkholderiaceae bacterium]|nr:protein translocase subunit SecF [Burkholderiaceae bacterium]
MELKYAKPANLESIRHTLEKVGYEQPEVTSFGTAHDVMLRLPVIKTVTGNAASQLVFDGLCKAEQGTLKQIDSVSPKGEQVTKTACVDAAGAETVSLQKVEFVGPQVGDELAQNGMNALAMVVIGVMIYLAIRFEWKFAVAAIIANLHDVVIILGFFAFFQWEFSLAVLAALKSQDPEVTLRRTEFVGPQVGEELVHGGLMALGMVVLGIVIYLAFRFEWKFGVAAIIANLHDVVIILGFFAFFQWEFSLTVLAAVLAVLGYSVNESVVIFDRIRENFRKQRKMSVHEVIDNAITSTISRTIITHGCTQMMVLSMLFLGGPTLHYFAVALTIGICFGIYSSVFVAAAVAMWLGVKREDLIKPIKEKDETDGAVV